MQKYVSVIFEHHPDFHVCLSSCHSKRRWHTFLKANASTIFVRHMAFYACLSSRSNISKCRQLMVHSEFIAVHRSTSADASLSQQLCLLQIFMCAKHLATEKTSIGRRRPMQNDGCLNASNHTWWTGYSDTGKKRRRQFEYHAGSKVAQVLGSLLYIYAQFYVTFCTYLVYCPV